MKAFQLFVRLTAYYAVVGFVIFAALRLIPDLREYLPIGGVEEMSRTIVELLQDTELRNEMGKRGVERVRSEFSLQRMVDDIERLYSEG